jgi:hypothetical protein
MRHFYTPQEIIERKDRGCPLDTMVYLKDNLILTKEGPIAQLVEPPAHNRKVPGSIPGGPTRVYSVD